MDDHVGESLVDFATQSPDPVREQLTDWATRSTDPPNTQSPPPFPSKPFFLQRQVEHCEKEAWRDIVPVYHCINKALMDVYPESELRRMGQGVSKKQVKILAQLKREFTIHQIPNYMPSRDDCWAQPYMAMVPLVDYQRVVDRVKEIEGGS